MAEPLVFDYQKIAFAAANYWARKLSPHVTRPGNLRDALFSAIVDSQHPTPTPVLLCSRPEQYAQRGYPGTNVLAVVAYDLKLSLADFAPGLVLLYPTLAPELQLHPQGKRRPLLADYPLPAAGAAAPLPPGALSWDPLTQSLVIPLSPDYNQLDDYELHLAQS